MGPEDLHFNKFSGDALNASPIDYVSLENPDEYQYTMGTPPKSSWHLGILALYSMASN